MKFSYSATWDEAARMIRSHAPLLVAVAGPFIFLPLLLVTILLPMPTLSSGDPETLMLDYYRENALWFVLTLLVLITGMLSILCIVLDEERSTVGALIVKAARLLPSYLAAILLTWLVMILVTLPLDIAARLSGIGALTLLNIVPALYLTGRFAPLGPAIVAENIGNPVAAIRRALALSKGRAWAITGLIILVVIACVVVMLAVAAVGSILILAAGTGIALVAVSILSNGVGATAFVTLIALSAAIYRQLRSTLSAADQG